MILLDAGPLIALLDEGDRLNRRAISDLSRLGTRPLFTCAPVLTEVCFALAAPFQRVVRRPDGSRIPLALREAP